MKVILDVAIDNQIKKNPSMHNDLIATQRASQEEQQRKFDRHFKETESAKFDRLSNEYNLIRDNEHAEWYILDLRTLKEVDVLLE